MESLRERNNVDVLEKWLYMPLLYFISYAMIGWCYELIFVAVKEYRIVNRGFLFGPWLPIYGFAGVLIYFWLYDYAMQSHEIQIRKERLNIKPIMVGFIVMLVAAFTELFSTYVMDLFGVDWTALWQYYDFSFNFDGRIALLPSLVFGLIGTFFIYYGHKWLKKLLENRSEKWCIVRNIIVFLFLFDSLVHCIIGSNFTDVSLLWF